ncbi:MAG: hypothetical protein ACXV3S_12520, partial [Kineosporiaceae bacterium]
MTVVVAEVRAAAARVAVTITRVAVTIARVVAAIAPRPVRLARTGHDPTMPRRHALVVIGGLPTTSAVDDLCPGTGVMDR